MRLFELLIVLWLLFLTLYMFVPSFKVMIDMFLI
ncbi:hypothetical protein MTsN2n4_21530 [Pseudoalteromonas sp. MTN2-4]